MDFEAVVVDLDGTLCDDRKIHRKDKRAVSEVIDIDVPVIPATTRMRYSTSLILNELDIDRYPLICNNGARVVGSGWKEYQSSEDIFNAFLDIDIAQALAAYTDERGYEITTIFREKKFWKNRNEHYFEELDEITEIVDDNLEAVEHGAPLSLMMHSQRNGTYALEDFERYASDFSKKVRLDRHHRLEKFTTLTLYRKGISKKKALDMVCEKLDIPIDKVLAIGDDEVDMSMLRYAGKGIAMGNSPEHVKKAADDVAPSCEEQGVSWILKKFLI